jgi:hypothetical protein
MVEVDRIACCRACKGQFWWSHFFVSHIFYGRNNTGQKILQRPTWVRSLRGWHYISPDNPVLHTIGELCAYHGIGHSLSYKVCMGCLVLRALEQHNFLELKIASLNYGHDYLDKGLYSLTDHRARLFFLEVERRAK